MRQSWIGILVCAGLCGCNSSSGGPPQAEAFPVKGVVTLDGKPLPGAEVVFMAGEPPTIGVARTNDDGSYELRGPAGRGAELQGACKVTVSRRVKPDGSPLGPDESPANVAAIEQLLPKYSRFDASTLTANVPAGGGTVDFPLTSK